jgi:CspA family cold shock protein
VATGVVRFYNEGKGFGLITPDIGGPPLFAHRSAMGPGVKTLKAAQRVQFDVLDTPQGMAASNIRISA